MNEKNRVDIIGRIPKWAWLMLSLITAVVVYTMLSNGKITGRAFPPLIEVLKSYTKMAKTYNVFWKDVASSLKAVGIGFCCEFTADICKEAGFQGLADALSFSCKVAILCLCIPLWAEVFSLIGGLLP